MHAYIQTYIHVLYITRTWLQQVYGYLPHSVGVYGHVVTDMDQERDSEELKRQQKYYSYSINAILVLGMSSGVDGELSMGVEGRLGCSGNRGDPDSR